MIDKANNTLEVGDRVVFGRVQPKYLTGAICTVDKIDRYSGKLSMTVERMKAGGPSEYRRRFREGTKIVRCSPSLVSKVLDA